MSRANFSVYSSTGSQPHPHYDEVDDAGYAPSEYEHEHHDQTGSYITSSSSESDISPNDSASIPATRGSNHARYQSHPRTRPPYPPSHEHSRQERPHRSTKYRRSPTEQYSRAEPSRHSVYPEHTSTPSDPSELSASVAYQHDRPVYSARDSYHEGQYAAPYPEQYWTGQSAHYPNHSTMTSSTSSNSHYSNPAALAAYEHHYSSQPHHYATQPSPGNPFMATPLPHAPSPQPGYGYDQYAQAYQPQRPEMLPRSSMGYLPADIQYSGFPPRPYSVPQNMMQAMMPSPYHIYQPAPAPEEKPAKPEKSEEPPAAPPPPPPPTAEEFKKRMEDEAALQAENVYKALKAIQLEEKAAAAAVAEKDQKVQAESDKIALLLAGFEKERLAREEAAAAKAAQEKAEAEAKAAREKELADAATAARENAVKEAATAAAIAKAENEKVIAEANAEHEKKMAEAKAAADAAEAAKKVAEEELKKNAPGPDADKPPLKFTDAVDRSFTLPWHLVKTWKGMETLIRQAFVNIERIGPHVANGHYHLLGPNGEIILPQVWDIVVQPGWDIKMQMWPLPPDPLEAKVNSGIGGFPPDIIPVMERPPRSSRSRPQVSGSKSAGKRASVGLAPPPPPPPPAAPAQHASPLPPPMHMPSVFVGHDDHDDPVVEIVEESHSRGRSGSSGGKSSANSSKKKQVPAFTRWMLGGGTRPRPKGAEKPAAGVKVRHIAV